MDKNNAATALTTLFHAHTDGSGVDCLITVGARRYAGNVLGARRAVTLLTTGRGSRVEGIRAAKRALVELERQLAALPAEWHAANAAMYPDERAQIVCPSAVRAYNIRHAGAGARRA